jgi:hypothetical protein
MHELDPCRKLTVLNPEGSLHEGKPKENGSELIEGFGKEMCVRN